MKIKTLKRKKIKELTDKEKKHLSQILNNANIAVFDELEVKRKLAKTLTDLLDIIDILLYGDERNNDRPRKNKGGKQFIR